MKKLLKVGSGICITSLVVSMGLNGCATTNTSNGLTSSSGGCNPAVMAGVGALLGALAGGREHRGAGAALGAGVGALACIGWNYNSRQTKTAEQVNNTYRASNNGALPEAPKVVAYDIGAAPSAISAGSPMVINSRIAIVGAASGPPPVVEQKIVVGHDGKEIASARKQANPGAGAGEYLTSFKVDLPKGVPQGSYPVSTSLYVNGSLVQSRNTAVQVVMNSGGPSIALID